MADIAYLYASDSADDWEVPAYDDNYYFSKWSVPLSWWIFFNLKDACNAEVFPGGYSMCISVPRLEALESFRRRRHCLDTCLDSEHLITIDELVADIERWDGHWLIMQPEEVIQDELPNCLPWLTQLMEAINSSNFDQFIEIAVPRSRFHVKEDFNAVVCSLSGKPLEDSQLNLIRSGLVGWLGGYSPETKRLNVIM
jgi:hypothetical protein